MPYRIEWITCALILFCYSTWAVLLIADVPIWLLVPALACVIALQSSLQHEVIHGHPTPWKWLNEGLMWPALNLAIPFLRFRDTHLAHHKNERLTDPYDDPESNFLSPAKWNALCVTRQAIMRVNNTLLGRLVLGPAIGQVYFMLGDWRLIRQGQRQIAVQWMWHFISVAAIVMIVMWSGTPIGAYLLAAYLGLSILKIRTFAEHQAHEKVGGRSVVIEDRGPLAFLFLNNNFHAVHHMHPKIAWYDLPTLYDQRKDRFLRRNHGYRFGSYWDLFRSHTLKAKDPVIHPHWNDPAE